jgi:hypothetical protein
MRFWWWVNEGHLTWTYKYLQRDIRCSLCNCPTLRPKYSPWTSVLEKLHVFVFKKKKNKGNYGWTNIIFWRVRVTIVATEEQKLLQAYISQHTFIQYQVFLQILNLKNFLNLRNTNEMIHPKNKYYIFWTCVCSLGYPGYKAHAPHYIDIFGLSGCITSSHII